MLRLLNTLVSVQITTPGVAFHVDGGALKQLAIIPQLANQRQRSNKCLIYTCEVPFKGKIICKPLDGKDAPPEQLPEGSVPFLVAACGWFGVLLPMECSHPLQRCP